MRTILLLLIFGISFFDAYTQLFPVLSFQRFYDNLGNDIPAKILKSKDGNLIVGGTTWNDNDAEEEANIYILKLKPDGDIIWERNIAIAGVQELRDMALTPEGEIMFVGVSTTLITHEESGDDAYWGDFIVGRLDNYGQVMWLQSYGGRNLDQAHAILATSAYEYLLAGGTHSRSGDVPGRNGMSDVWVLQIDEQGNKGFSRTYGGRNNDWANKIISCRNGDFLLAGYTNSDDMDINEVSMYGNGLLMRITPGGRLLWQRAFTCPNGGYFSDIVENEYGEIFLVGNLVKEGNKRDFWWMLLDDRGEKIFEFTPSSPNDEWLETLVSCTGGGFLMGGGGKSNTLNGPYDKGKEDFWLIRTDPQGRIVWQNTYGGPDHERCRDIIEYSPGVFYAIGEKINDFEKGKNKGKDFWLLRIEERNCNVLKPSIFVRAPKFKAARNQPIRFRARHTHGDRFYWTFGDGTTSEEANPLKTYEFPGVYHISLTIYANENCQQTGWIPKPLKID